MNFDYLRKKYISMIPSIDIYSLTPKDCVTVQSPLRVNLSAGWNDTPPYCNETVGYTLNAPILLDHNFPVTVHIRKLEEAQIVLKNRDSNSSCVIKNSLDILDCQSPLADFALHKSCLLASGLIPFDETYDLSSFLNQFGGFELSSSVKNIPVGSGLGTSSILIFSCIKAIYNFCNLPVSDLDLFHMTACAEQIMTTGGGYQDQIGAYCKDFKFISFAPGMYPNITCENLNLSKNIKTQLQDKLIFIYTGNTRVAKNLLQKIMGNYIANDPSTVQVLNEIGVVAQNMRTNLIEEDLESFALNMTRSFELNVALNPSFTNDSICKLLDFLAPFLDGYMLSGAGNGGFLTVLLKDNHYKKDIVETSFADSNIKIYNFNLWF